VTIYVPSLLYGSGFYYGGTYPYYPRYPVTDIVVGEPRRIIRAQTPDGVAPVDGDEENEVGQRYLAEAREAFRRGDYAAAARLASHAAVELPRSSDVHQFTSLTFVALANYRPAAAAAHVGLELGRPWDWATLRRHYGDPADYTPHLRALEEFAGKNAKAAYAQFLLGYHYLMLGHTEPAARRFARVVQLEPRDDLVKGLLKSLRGEAQSDSTPRIVPLRPAAPAEDEPQEKPKKTESAPRQSPPPSEHRHEHGASD